MPLVTLLPSLPTVEWFAELTRHDEVIFDQEMHYDRSMGLNQAAILTAGGILKLSVPVEKHLHHTPIKNVRIAYENTWQKKQWQAIASAYGRSAYYLYYADAFESAFHKHFVYLKDRNEELFGLCRQFLKLHNPIIFAGDYKKEYPADYTDERYRRKNRMPRRRVAAYRQVFTENKFIPGLSIIDLIFNEGPASAEFLIVKESGKNNA